VPAGKVLVLTHLDDLLGGGAATDVVALFIYRTDGPGNRDISAVPQASVNTASGAFDLGAIVLEPGVGVCLYKTGTFSGGNAHARGYLADDD
jgi:hypothetical protein